jgi:amino acid permease
LFESISNTQFSLISGDELLKFDKVPIQIQKFILGSNSSLVEAFELSENLCSLNEEASTATNQDSPFAMSLQISIHAGSKKVILVGFYGYEELKDKKELYLMQENQQIINNFVKKHALNSLTPTIYDSVNKCSVYERYSTCT